MKVRSWNIPQGHRLAVYANNGPNYFLYEEGTKVDEKLIHSIAPMHYVQSKPLRFVELALEQAFDKIAEQVKIAHGKLEESGQPPDMVANILIFQDAVSTGRDPETHNNIASVGWSCLFGDVVHTPDWLQEFDWSEYTSNSA